MQKQTRTLWQQTRFSNTLTHALSTEPLSESRAAGGANLEKETCEEHLSPL